VERKVLTPNDFSSLPEDLAVLLAKLNSQPLARVA